MFHLFIYVYLQSKLFMIIKYFMSSVHIWSRSVFHLKYHSHFGCDTLSKIVFNFRKKYALYFNYCISRTYVHDSSVYTLRMSSRDIALCATTRHRMTSAICCNKI